MLSDASSIGKIRKHPRLLKQGLGSLVDLGGARAIAALEGKHALFKNGVKMFKIYFAALLILCTGCTYSVIMNHSEGETSDVVDETSNPSAQVNPNVSVIPT